MAFDTKYRPQNYNDVLGQDEYIEVLMEIVRSGTGLHQSYLFCGQHGSGKTTLGRILARALLCTDNQAGAPCDKCDSCLAVLEGRSECFIEFDAATNSGKDDIKQLVEEQHVSTFSGQQRIYLFDESHQLSKQALDALLKPMEDEQPGTENKQLVCIFCTTEPERMRSTIFSRCAPAFVIRSVAPKDIATRMAYIAVQEGLEYDQEALVMLAEFHESHFRDALKSMEGISKLGRIDLENARRYLRTSVFDICLQVLLNLGKDLGAVLHRADELRELVSPSVAYKRLMEIAMVAFKTKHGAGHVPAFWDAALVKEVTDSLGDYLIVITGHLSSRPGRPTHPMLACDLAHLHHGKLGTMPVMGTAQINAPVAMMSAPLVNTAPPPSPVGGDPKGPSQTSTRSAPAVDPDSVETSPPVGKVQTDPGKAHAPNSGSPKAVPEARHGDGEQHHQGRTQPTKSNLDFYRMVLRARVAELEAQSGSAGRSHMGGDRTFAGR